jgi:hypothetical protein
MSSGSLTSVGVIVASLVAALLDADIVGLGGHADDSEDRRPVR